MKNVSLLGLLLASTLATGCSFQQSTKLFSPTAPSSNDGAAGSTKTGGPSTGGASTSGGGSTTTGGGSTGGGSPFNGVWGSPTIAGLPLGNCSDVKWQINSQSDTSIAGTVNATCASGVVVAANLNGTLQSADVINLIAEGTLTAMGLPCPFKLTGVGTRQTGDTLKLDYNGTYCLGTLNGSEILRKPDNNPVVVLAPPTLVSPSNGTTLNGIVPQFTLKAGNRSGATGPIEYILEVSNDASFTSIAARFFQDETLPDTTIATGYSFLNSKTYYWRARTGHNHGAHLSDWSATRTFKTPVPVDPGGGGGGGGTGAAWTKCGSTPGKPIVECVRNAVYTRSTTENAFDVTKRVAWLLRDKGFGLLIKEGGENIITWHGHSVSISRIMLPSGQIMKVLSDAGPGGSNGASWQQCDDRNDVNCFVERDRYVPAMQPEW